MTSRKADNQAADATTAAKDPFGAAQNPFTHAQQFWSYWGNFAQEHLSGWEKAGDEFRGWQDRGMKRAEETADEVTKLFKASVGYANELSAQVRDMSVDAAKRTATLISNAGR